MFLKALLLSLPLLRKSNKWVIKQGERGALSFGQLYLPDTHAASV